MACAETEVQVADKEVRGNFNPRLFREKERDWSSFSFERSLPSGLRLHSRCIIVYETKINVESRPKGVALRADFPRRKTGPVENADARRRVHGIEIKTRDRAGLIFLKSARYPTNGEAARDTANNQSRYQIILF